MISLAQMLETHIRFEEQVMCPIVEGVAIEARAQASSALCSRCDREHADHDLDGELFDICIPCQAELVEAALQLHDDL